MLRVLITSTIEPSRFARQTPHGSGRWGEFQFLFEPDDAPVDAWVVYDDVRQPITQLCAPANTLLITGNPKSLGQYRSSYFSQFGQIWTSHTGMAHSHVTIRHEAQPWLYAMQAGRVHQQPLGIDDLKTLACPVKTKQVSVLCSDKAITADHRHRIEFVRYLQSELGDQIDVFGYGVRPVADKSEAIWPYKYHIVLENDHSEHYMSEKLPDAFLGWSYPIYFGGKEAYHRFPEGSFTAIDIHQPEKSLNVIRNVLASETYEHGIERIAEARASVFAKHNLFAMLAEYWRTSLVRQPASLITLLPRSHRTSLVVQQIKRTLTRRAA